MEPAFGAATPSDDTAQDDTAQDDTVRGETARDDTAQEVTAPRVAVVIPTVGRDSLHTLLGHLARELRDAPGAVPVAVVDDRPGTAPLEVRTAQGSERVPSMDLRVLRSGGRGPAAARNVGWRHVVSDAGVLSDAGARSDGGVPSDAGVYSDAGIPSDAGRRAPHHGSGADGPVEWVVFVDDDVELPQGWWNDLAADLRCASPRVAAVQARLSIPMPTDRAPTDRERDVAGLAGAAWITADMAVRAEALIEVGGFEERFRRAYREDTDLAIRLRRVGWSLARGERAALHPVRPASWWTPVRAQRGNADDALMARLHGPSWREEGEAPAGLLPLHAVTTAALLTGVATAAAATVGASRATSRSSGAAAVLRVASLTSLGIWLGSWWRFWRHRRHDGISASEDLRVAATSAVIPPAATFWAVWGRAVLARRASVTNRDSRRAADG